MRTYDKIYVAYNSDEGIEIGSLPILMAGSTNDKNPGSALRMYSHYQIAITACEENDKNGSDAIINDSNLNTVVFIENKSTEELAELDEISSFDHFYKVTKILDNISNETIQDFCEESGATNLDEEYLNSISPSI